MVSVPSVEVTPEVVAPIATATPEVLVVKTPKKRKQLKAEQATTVPAAPAAEGIPEAAPTEGAAPVVKEKKITEKTYGKGLPNSGSTRTYDLPWSAKKVAVLSTLKKLGAVGLTSLKGCKSVIEAAAADGITLTGRDVRHYCYHAAASGLTVVVEKPEGVAGHGFYLTQAGADTDYPAVLAGLVKPVAAPKVEAATVPTEPAAPAPEPAAPAA